MFFRTCEHYDDHMSDNNAAECLVCFEHVPPTICLRNQTQYRRPCDCDGLIHTDCLAKWVQMTHRCPICRTHVHMCIRTANYDNIYTVAYYIHRFIILFFIPIYTMLLTCQLLATLIKSPPI